MENVIVGFLYVLVSLIFAKIYNSVLDIETSAIFGFMTLPALWIIGGLVRLTRFFD